MNTKEAVLLSFITSLASRPLDENEILHMVNLLCQSQKQEAGLVDLGPLFEALRGLKDGKKIDAIREVRTLTHLGLKEAKDLVESL